MKRDVIIIGAGAAGLFCAIEAGKRGRSVLLLDHASKVGKKILISGGGRCNFTNLHASPAAYLSGNEHFCKSALARFTQHDFVELLDRYQIAYHEKKLGQLFCDNSARDIVKVLLAECEKYKVEILLNCSIRNISKGELFELATSNGMFSSDSLVVASGGLSIAKMGASALGYDIARQFGVPLRETRPGLVPFTFDKSFLDITKELSGISLDAELRCGSASFRENILFTHRGLSGPAVLQISSYWKDGDSIVIDVLPGVDLAELLAQADSYQGELKTMLCHYLPKRFVKKVFEVWLKNRRVADLREEQKQEVVEFFQSWKVTPKGTEGYRTAEVTVGGVDVNELSSKTFECKKSPGLFFIGEVLDVTGWLGGYNLQWAWSSGYCAGQFV